MDLTKVLSVVKSKKTGFSQQEYYSEQQVSKHYQVRMQRNCIQIVQQLFFVQKNV